MIFNPAPCGVLREPSAMQKKGAVTHPGARAETHIDTGI
jgi:hypothetical protein